MNSTRLYILGALALGGPMHGHQIRRAAQLDRSELWSEVKPGSLYGALHRMAAEGIIEVVRTERAGNLPARTVYRITPEGRAELNAHRDEALRDTRLRPDPVDLALKYTHDLAEEQLLAVMQDRRQAVALQLSSWEHLRETAHPHLSPLERVVFEHALVRLRAELAWHDLILEELPKVLAAEREEGSK